LSDSFAGDFRYTLKSLGLEDSEALVFVTVNSPFDMAKQQLVYLTPEKDTQVDVPGAQYSFQELKRVLEASDGRSLVLFTARTELEHAADEFQRSDFPHSVLVQERVSNKQLLVDEFKRDTSSVLLATKSFFTGVDFPGETCSVVVLAKYPLPQYNVLCRAQVAWWRSRGFPNWYEREATLVARQAVGRLIRTESDHGVVALLDQRPGMHQKIIDACAGSYVTRDVEDVKKWLHTE
jgi:ATP-dependent DNA helicase DinG